MNNEENENEYNNKKIKNLGALITFLAMFSVFCILRMWLAIPLVFLFAFGMTLISGKRNYCSHYCPMGYIQDSFYTEPKNEQKKKLSKKIINILSIIVFIIFWNYLFYYVGKLYDSPQLLWPRIFILIISSGITAIISQKYIKKRFWCAHLCPVGKILNLILKIRN